MKIGKWVEKWEVEGSNGHIWVVSKSDKGIFGCSCPVWRFKRQECHHILQIKNGVNYAEYQVCPGNVGEVTIKKKEKIILYPLVRFGDVDQRATIVYDLWRLGLKEEAKRYKDKMFGSSYSLTSIINYVKQKGRLIFTEWREGEGWVNPQYVDPMAPIKTI